MQEVEGRTKKAKTRGVRESNIKYKSVEGTTGEQKFMPVFMIEKEGANGAKAQQSKREGTIRHDAPSQSAKVRMYAR